MYSLLILVPLLGVILLNLPFISRVKRLAFWTVAVFSFGQIILVILDYLKVFSGVPDAPGLFFNLDLNVDSLSLIMLFCIGVVMAAAVIVANYIIKDAARIFDFSNLLFIILAGMNGVVMTVDIFSLYVFLEITSVSSFILIAFYKKMDALEGAIKYIMLSAFASVMMLSSIALILLISGDTGFAAIRAALVNSPHAFFFMFAIGIFLCGLFIKAGLMPFHGWLPDAYSEAPAPVSILLAGVITKTLGVYTLMRIVLSVFGFNPPIKEVLLFIGAMSIVAGALASCTQKDFKRMLSYSSISQVGYIIIGLGSGTPLGIAGAAFHLFNHAIFKSLLFINSAAVEFQTGTRDMSRMSGLASRMPVTGITSIFGSLSAAGIPPLSGFWSKLMIIMALWVSGRHGYAIVTVLASGLTLTYFLSMQRMAFFGKINEEFKDVKEAGPGLIIPAAILALIIIVAGLLFPVVIDNFILPVENLLRS